jgi:transposase
MSEKSARSNYTKEFKQDAVKLVVEHGYSCQEAGRRLGIACANVSRWVRQHREEQQPDGPGKLRRELEEENRRLKKENQRLRMEREILKKAAAFFAKESS